MRRRREKGDDSDGSFDTCKANYRQAIAEMKEAGGKCTQLRKEIEELIMTRENELRQLHQKVAQHETHVNELQTTFDELSDQVLEMRDCEEEDMSLLHS